MPSLRVLVLNPGSSSLKAALVELPDGRLGSVEVSWGADASRIADRASGLEEVLDGLSIGRGPDDPAGRVDAVGYRVVHGGDRLTHPVLIDDAVLEDIRSVADLAPLHNGVAIETIEAGRSTLPDVPHVACFDTAFHATLVPEAYRYPVPSRWFDEWGIRRYGFHGLSVDWASQRSAELLGEDRRSLGLVVAHLGSGCSVSAVEGGRSVATSMGMTPLEGLMMGTRSGSIDPGVPFHLIRKGYLDAGSVIDELEHRSGLLGVSGTSSDMRALQAAADAGDGHAALAIAMFVGRAAASMAAAATTLTRLDAVVFTGGIGEHAIDVRRAIVDRLGVVGVQPLSQGRVEADDDRILSDPGAGVAVLRITAREDLVIARQAAALIS